VSTYCLSFACSKVDKTLSLQRQLTVLLNTSTTHCYVTQQTRSTQWNADAVKPEAWRLVVIVRRCQQLLQGVATQCVLIDWCSFTALSSRQHSMLYSQRTDKHTTYHTDNKSNNRLQSREKTTVTWQHLDCRLMAANQFYCFVNRSSVGAAGAVFTQIHILHQCPRHQWLK